MTDSPLSIFSRLAVCLMMLNLAACTMGPDFKGSTPDAPKDWSTWHSGAAELTSKKGVQGSPSPQWWHVFNDATLDRLQEQAKQASPDLHTAALRLAQARVQRLTVVAQRGPEVNAGGSVTRQHQSEFASSSRIIDSISGDNRDDVAAALSKPFTLYQAGFDASWEVDVWGRVRRSVEAADADVEASAALLDETRLSIAGELARNYFELRTSQRLLQIARQDIEALVERFGLMQTRASGGLTDDLDLERQRAQLADLRAELPVWQEQETQSINRIGLLLGTPPGSLQQELALSLSVTPSLDQGLPDYTLGLPSEVARRRPDIRVAEAQLHQATASVGIAQADLYPSIRLGASFGYESFDKSRFGDWGSRTWSVGPTLDLPIFDNGRRRATVKLRELEQQQAAITYQQTVLKAWYEVDDALSGYSAEGEKYRHLQIKARSSAQSYEWAQTRYRGGLIDFLEVLDTQRSYLKARRDLVASEGRLHTRFVAIQKAIAAGIPVATIAFATQADR